MWPQRPRPINRVLLSTTHNLFLSKCHRWFARGKVLLHMSVSFSFFPLYALIIWYITRGFRKSDGFRATHVSHIVPLIIVTELLRLLRFCFLRFYSIWFDLIWFDLMIPRSDTHRTSVIVHMFLRCNFPSKRWVNNRVFVSAPNQFSIRLDRIMSGAFRGDRTRNNYSYHLPPRTKVANKQWMHRTHCPKALHVIYVCTFTNYSAFTCLLILLQLVEWRARKDHRWSVMNFPRQCRRDCIGTMNEIHPAFVALRNFDKRLAAPCHRTTYAKNWCC